MDKGLGMTMFSFNLSIQETKAEESLWVWDKT